MQVSSLLAILELVLDATSILAVAISNGEPQTIQLAAPASPLSHLPADILPPTRFPILPLSPNESVALLNTSVSTDYYGFTCDGSKFGFFDNVEDCVSALNIIIPSQIPIVFAERGSPGAGTGIFPLPWRWMGRKIVAHPIAVLHELTRWLEKPSCYIEPILRSGVQSGSINLSQLRDAALALMTHCALRQGQGGMITNPGERQACSKPSHCFSLKTFIADYLPLYQEVTTTSPS